MTIHIKTSDIRLFIPISITIAEMIIRLLPEKVYDKIKLQIPVPYHSLCQKQTICIIMKECHQIIRQNRGLQIVHIETSDGTLVSIKL